MSDCVPLRPVTSPQQRYVLREKITPEEFRLLPELGVQGFILQFEN